MWAVWKGGDEPAGEDVDVDDEEENDLKELMGL
jgi:hypothetical protein